MDYQNQLELEKLFSKNQLMKRLTYEFNDPEIREHCIANDIDPDIGIEILVQMYLHKRTTVPVMVGIMKRHFDSLQECADTMLKAVDADLMDWNEVSKQFIYRIAISQEVQDEIDRYQYPLPMVYAPKELMKNTDTGYYTHSGSVILKDNHTDHDVCLDHLNRINKVKLRINPETARMVKADWKNLDKPKPGEEFTEFKSVKDAFAKYIETAHDIMQHLYMAGNEFYLTHKYDKRGRTYACGYQVNTQGTPYNKAVVEFR